MQSQYFVSLLSQLPGIFTHIFFFFTTPPRDLLLLTFYVLK